MATDQSKYLELFFQEVAELLTLLNQRILELEKDYSNSEAIDEIFRITHTIKGNSAAMGFDLTKTLAHALEDVFDLIRRDKLEFNSEIADIVFEGVDYLDKIITELKKTGNETLELPPVTNLLRRIANGESISDEESVEIAEPDNSIQKADIEKSIKLLESVRVPLKKLDLMLNFIGEAIIDISYLDDLNAELKNRELKDLTTHFQRIVSELQYNMMKVRLLPLSSIMDQFPRMVRDLTKQEGKKIEVEIVGADIELDSKVIEKLKSPLVHIIRNAVSHGCEPPHHRVALGKQETAKITLKAERKKDRVEISVADDGIGINAAKIAQKAVDMGIVAMDVALELIDEETYELIFEPGFTTAKKVSEISGRGVGMDAVRSELSSIGGIVKVKSIMGEGTSFILNIPLSIAVNKVLLCKIAGKTMAFPSSAIGELIRKPEAEISYMGGNEHLHIDEKLVPILDLSAILYNSPSQKDDTDELCFIVSRFGSRTIIFKVESFLKEENIVVKNFWIPEDIRRVSGATILSDGEVALILDPNEIVKIESLKQGGENGQG